LRGRAFLEFVCVENEKIGEEKQLATEEFSSSFFREKRNDTAVLLKMILIKNSLQHDMSFHIYYILYITKIMLKFNTVAIGYTKT